MKTERSSSVNVPDVTEEPYPYPQWSPNEEVTLSRWYSVLGLKQCSEMWFQLTGRDRSVEQIDNKSRRLGIQDNIPTDWLDLFEEGE